jgi:hypothetical protein
MSLELERLSFNGVQLTPTLLTQIFSERVFGLFH